jgi:hypothetical protein
MNDSLLIALITTIFITQLLVVSIYFPLRLHRITAALLHRCPPAEYPRLYPMSVARLRQFGIALAALRVVVVGFGLFLLTKGLWQHDSPQQLTQSMTLIMLLQLVPALLRVPLQLHLARLMRQQPAPAVRSAPLGTLRLTDLVSPVAIACGFGAIIMALTTTALAWLWTARHDKVLLTYNLIVAGLLLTRMLHVTIAGPALARPDPYMTDQDLFAARQRRMRFLFRASTSFGLLITGMQIYFTAAAPQGIIFISCGLSILIQVYVLYVARMTARSAAGFDYSAYRVAAAARMPTATSG